jgi:ABC-type xylose transport system permease subunit
MTSTVIKTPDTQDERLVVEGWARALWGRVSRGDIGALPVILGTIVIFVVFQSLNRYFLSSSNLVDLMTDLAAIGTISVGIVLVLLVAQIDLSVGSMSGVASSILGVGLVTHGYPLGLVIPAALLVGLVVGIVFGWGFVTFGVPSFVVTLAGLLALLGLQLYLLGSHGSINLPFTSRIVEFMQTSYVPHTLSYVLAALLVALYVASGQARRVRRARHGLSVPHVGGLVVRAVLLLAAALVFSWYLNRDRGVSAPFVLFLALVIVMEFLLTRTRWGRAVYAVGGSVEAARRSGINVKMVYLSVFGLCSMLAALGGLMSAGRLATASISSGVGDTNLDAIAAAVIGGTSLFGGRGSAWSALLGMVVIQSIASGLTLLNLDASVRYMITGGVLMLAVTVDSVARRSRASSGVA